MTAPEPDDIEVEVGVDFAWSEDLQLFHIHIKGIGTVDLTPDQAGELATSITSHPDYDDTEDEG